MIAFIVKHKKLVGFILGGATGIGLFKLVSLSKIAMLPTLVSLVILLGIAFNVLVWNGAIRKRNAKRNSKI